MNLSELILIDEFDHCRSLADSPSFINRVVGTNSTFMWNKFINEQNYRLTLYHFANTENVTYRSWLWKQEYTCGKYLTDVLCKCTSPHTYSWRVNLYPALHKGCNICTTSG